MGTRGPLVRLKANAGKEEEVEALLRSTLSLVQQDPGTLAQIAVRFSLSEYGTAGLFESAPSIQPLDELANKRPKGAAVDAPMGSSLRFNLRAHHKRNAEHVLCGGEPLLAQETKTTAWFAIRTSDGKYGLFGVFPDNAGCSAPLPGHVPGELVKRAFALPGSVPNPAFLPASSLQPESGTFR